MSSRCYIRLEANEAVYKGRDNIDLWNAPLFMKDSKGVESKTILKKLPKNSTFKSRRNFVFEKFVSSEDGGIQRLHPDDPNDITTLSLITGIRKVFYAPIITSPGYYTVRYCLDDLKADEDFFNYDNPKNVSKKLQGSKRSFYYNRFVDTDPDAAKRKICSKAGIGDDK